MTSIPVGAVKVCVVDGPTGMPVCLQIEGRLPVGWEEWVSYLHYQSVVNRNEYHPKIMEMLFAAGLINQIDGN